MINIYIVLGILFFHWVFDFILQTDEDAKGKSSSWKHLLNHTKMYSMGWIVVSLIYFMFSDFIITDLSTFKILLFAPITFLAHTATDYYTSKVNSQLWKEGDSHGFFISIGFDQFLHFSQLLLTFYWLT